MKTRPPVNGTTPIDVNTRAAPFPDGTSRIPPPAIRPDIDSLPTPRLPAQPSAGKLQTEIDVDAILPAPTLLISELSTGSTLSAPAQEPLKNYRFTGAARLPEADANGVRSFKGRQFVDLADGGIIQIGIDPHTGLHRATRQTEQQPSGPILVRDPVSRQWHAPGDLETIIFPLSDTRLAAFRTQLDFSDTEPDSDGLFRHDGKLYAVIHEYTYQVLRDREASSPQVAVMRIVRSEDPIAADDANVFVGTRVGRSEPIALDPRDGWVGVNVPGQGGMRQGQPQRPIRQSLSERFAAFVNRSNRPENRVRKLFPGLNDAQVEAYLQALGDNAASALTRKESEYKTLKKDLLNWSRENAQTSPANQAQTKLVRQAIKRCWRRETEPQLRLAAEGLVLPALTADFSHVRILAVDSASSTSNVDTFLKSFTGLEQLTLSGCNVEKLPAAIRQMPDLTILDLSANNLRLDTTGAETLSALNHLEQLVLAQNPLDVLPDFSNLPRLKYLDLNHTGINEWPTGLHSNASWVQLDLSHNQLKSVPQAYINPTPDQLPVVASINGVTRLAGNDFPSGYSSHFDLYWRRLYEDHPALAKTAHADSFDLADSAAQRYRQLYPAKKIEQCREYIYGLEPGVAHGRLASLEHDFNLLNAQLDAWVFSGGGERQRYIRADQIQLNAETRDDRTIARDRIVACWRQETPLQLARDQTPIGLELDLSGLRLPSLPDIDVDFNHVGSLKLSNMNLRTSPEGFLTRFRHVRWLDLSNNQLRELPPAIGEMNAMTRLALQHNQITLTPESALVLSGRTTLRALSLNANPRLHTTPDFSRITDMRSLHLNHTGIEHFPTGLGDQPLLDNINLSDNQISHIPQDVIDPPDDRLLQSMRANNVTNLFNNPLSAETRARVDMYELRLATAEAALSGPDNIIRSSRRYPTHTRTTPWRNNPWTSDSAARWTTGLSDEQAAARKTQWQLLRNQEGSGGFFATLDALLRDRAGHDALQRRVWKVIDSMTENTPESESLRRELFDRAGEAACRDRAAFTFANLETRALVHYARAQAKDQAQGPQLSALSKALFRLHEVDKIAAADIARREEKARASRGSQQAHASGEHLIAEEVEIRLAYRHGLKDRLQLPAQPDRAPFVHLVGVSQADLNAAYKTVKALDGSPEEFQALLSREFWQDFITHKYRSQFEMQRQPFQDRQFALDQSYAEKKIEFAEYEAQAKSLQNSLAIEEAALIETLTRQELSEHSTTAVSKQTAAGTQKRS